MTYCKNRSPHTAAGKAFLVHPKAFIFYDKETGARRFEVKAEADGSMPSDQAVGLIALHCVMRGQVPDDLGVMVAVGEDLFDTLGQRVRKLIHNFPAAEIPVEMTSRQKEVFRAVLENLANKEIAQKLNISVRTAKFHVSALLVKFQVPDRVTLMRKAADLLAVGMIPADLAPSPLTITKKSDSPLAIRNELGNSHERHIHLNQLERRSRG